jgi:hypothetical protein
MTDTDARDPLVIDENYPLKRGKLLFVMIQFKRNSSPITSLIVKDNKATYNKFMHHMFDFGQELRAVYISELGWKPFLVADPQYMKISQLYMERGLRNGGRDARRTQGNNGTHNRSTHGQ